MVDRDLRDAPDLGTFVEYEDAAFTVERGDGTEVELRLREIDTSNNRRRDDWRQFSLRFDVVGEEHLEGDLYRVTHPDLGPFDLNIEPKATASPDPEDVVYESVFNRHVPEEDSGGLFGDGPSRRGVLGGLLGLLGGALLGGSGGTARAAEGTATHGAAGAGALAGTSPYLGTIGLFANVFAPRDWKNCDGQVLQITQYTALFSLLGTQYGGDGQTTFALPDLRGRVPVHTGRLNGSGTAYAMGDQGGTETVSLSEAEMPSHAHDVQATTDEATKTSPEGNVLAKSPTGRVPAYADATAGKSMNAVTSAGSGQAHENRMPYTVVRYCIAVSGTYPPRN